MSHISNFPFPEKESLTMHIILHRTYISKFKTSKAWAGKWELRIWDWNRFGWMQLCWVDSDSYFYFPGLNKELKRNAKKITFQNSEIICCQNVKVSCTYFLILVRRILVYKCIWMHTISNLLIWMKLNFIRQEFLRLIEEKLFQTYSMNESKYVPVIIVQFTFSIEDKHKLMSKKLHDLRKLRIWKLSFWK